MQIIIAENPAFCYGVERAYDLVKQQKPAIVAGFATGSPQANKLPSKTYGSMLPQLNNSNKFSLLLITDTIILSYISDVTTGI